MLVIQAIGCVALQIIFTYITRHFKDFTLSIIGMLCFALGFALIEFFL
jgi:hypothetical protein